MWLVCSILNGTHGAHIEAISARDAQTASDPNQDTRSPYTSVAGPPLTSPFWKVLKSLSATSWRLEMLKGAAHHAIDSHDAIKVVEKATRETRPKLLWQGNASVSLDFHYPMRFLSDT